MKNNFNSINENFKNAFESAIPKGFSSTFCKYHKGFSGMPAAVFRSFSCHYHDRESNENPYVTCNFPSVLIMKSEQML